MSGRCQGTTIDADRPDGSSTSRPVRSRAAAVGTARRTERAVNGRPARLLVHRARDARHHGRGPAPCAPTGQGPDRGRRGSATSARARSEKQCGPPDVTEVRRVRL